MKSLWMFGAAAAALVAATAAIAQSPAVQTRQPLAEKIVTRAEVQAGVAKHFARLDADRDGFVTRAEADARKAERTQKRAERRAGRFDRIDADHDGSISRAEFDARTANHRQRVAARDHDGDGKPDRRMRRMGHGKNGFGGRMLAMADGNKDGRVSAAEATAMALQHFDMADANRDGRVTREERQQMRRKMRAGHQQNHG